MNSFLLLKNIHNSYWHLIVRDTRDSPLHCIFFILPRNPGREHGDTRTRIRQLPRPHNAVFLYYNSGSYRRFPEPRDDARAIRGSHQPVPATTGGDGPEDAGAHRPPEGVNSTTLCTSPNTD